MHQTQRLRASLTGRISPLRRRSFRAAARDRSQDQAAEQGSAPTTRPLRRRPILLALVYGVFLVLVAITATAQVIVATTHFSTETLNATVARDRTLVRIFVDGNLRPADLSLADADRTRVDLLQRQLAAFVERGEILRVELRDVDGRVVLSNDPTVRGTIPARAPGFELALGARISADLADASGSRHAGPASLAAPAVLEEYVPLVSSNGEVQAVFGIWRDAEPMLAALTRIRNESILVTLVAAAVLAVMLFLVFRAANSRIAQQTVELVEATRRDTLTGLVNHGTLVGVLAEVVESERGKSDGVGVALVDVDNFRLLNEIYGHEAGDAILREVAGSLQRLSPPGVTIGRYGPDEFLIVAPGGPPAVTAVVEPLKAALRATAMRFHGSERLPLTLSAGICGYPDHAEAVTELLASVAWALREAKAGGGDQVVIARTEVEDDRRPGGFDVLQGLVIAVDTKDRYTKRHSEDVARYGLFIADQLDLDAETRRTIQISGLLHDVGKIGIPDEILRKPGKLTDDEYDVVKQHVKLGDMIVRDLPEIDAVRAGIRHHHERWDGHGYLDRLAGTEIPLVARVLAVADAFSAMTTSRPYRKALTVEEAIRRLEDAAGTQLDETLVAAFIGGLQTAADPPLPGVVAPGRLWTPLTQVA